MGSSVSVTSELSPPASTTASTAASANPPSKTAVPASPAQDPVFKTCWSCRLLSGCTIFGAGCYVYLVARRPLKQGIPPGPGTIAHMVIGISIACWGAIVLADPKGKAYRVV